MSLNYEYEVAILYFVTGSIIYLIETVWSLCQALASADHDNSVIVLTEERSVKK